MKLLKHLLIIASLASASVASPSNVNELLASIKGESAKERQENQAREPRF